MLTFSKITLSFLYLSIVVLIFVFVFLVGSFQPLYYLLWVIGIGGYVYRHQVKIGSWLKGSTVGGFKKYLGIGLTLILLEEVFASISMHLMRYLATGSVSSFFSDVLQFWIVNLLALPGMLLAWYVLLKRYSYSYAEIFCLAGLFGLFSEKIYLHVVAYPLFGWALIIPTIFTYGLLVVLPVMSLEGERRAGSKKALRYTLALALPVLFSVPFIGILSYIHSVHPEFFPPFGFFSE